MSVTGQVNARLEAVIPLRLRGPSGSETEIDAVVDTGYTGTLSAPESVVMALGLVRLSGGRAVLADGSSRRFDRYDAEVEWGGVWRPLALSALGNEALAGMGLLAGYELRLQAVAGGAVGVALMAAGDPISSDEPLIFRVRLTEDEAVYLRRCQDFFLLRPAYRLMAWWLAVFVAGMLAWFLFARGPELIALLFAVSAAYVLAMPLDRAWHTRRHYRRHPDQYPETEARLTSNRVAILSDKCRMDFAWQLLNGLSEGPKGIIFYGTSRQTLLWLPTRVFEENDLRSRVITLATANGVRVSKG